MTYKARRTSNVSYVSNSLSSPYVLPAAATLLAILRRQLRLQNLGTLARHILPTVDATLYGFLAQVFLLMRDLVAAIPHIYMFLKVMHRIPATISLVFHDNITSEDALGRLHSLQYQQFRH